jgi:DNA-binding transcriptional MerR regulator
MKAYTETAIEKVYFSISEVADRLGVSNSNVRYWCAEFDIKPLRSYKKGNRRFILKDLETLLRVKELSDSGLYTLKGIREQLKESTEDFGQWLLK